jgi:DNA mismatch endonuclease (patch repair protein)
MDKFSPEKRSATMRAVHSKKTKLEDSVSKALWKKGVRFRRNVIDLVGKPDISIKRKKFVLFIDSCFWHGCEEHCRLPETNKDYWTKKINRNRERDQKITDYYLNAGWNIVRVWEHELKVDFNQTILKEIR